MTGKIAGAGIKALTDGFEALAKGTTKSLPKPSLPKTPQRDAKLGGLSNFSKSEGGPRTLLSVAAKQKPPVPAKPDALRSNPIMRDAGGPALPGGMGAGRSMPMEQLANLGHQLVHGGMGAAGMGVNSLMNGAGNMEMLSSLGQTYVNSQMGIMAQQGMGMIQQHMAMEAAKINQKTQIVNTIAEMANKAFDEAKKIATGG